MSKKRVVSSEEHQITVVCLILRSKLHSCVSQRLTMTDDPMTVLVLAKYGLAVATVRKKGIEISVFARYDLLICQKYVFVLKMN